MSSFMSSGGKSGELWRREQGKQATPAWVGGVRGCHNNMRDVEENEDEGILSLTLMRIYIEF